MPAQTDVQHCVSQCQQVESQLRNMAQAETNLQHKKLLDEGAHHLRMCLEECNWSLQQLQAASPR